MIEYTSSALLDQALHPLPAAKLRTRSTLDLAAFEEETLAVGARGLICAGTGLTPCHIGPWAYPAHNCIRTGLTPPTAALG